MSLQVNPKLWRSTKVSGKPERCIGSDGAATKHDIIGTRARYFDDLRQGVNTDLHGLQEIITQNFTGMNWRKFLTAAYVCKVDPPGIQIFSLNAYRITPCGNPRLFGPFCQLTFTRSHTRAAAVLVDELDAGRLYGAPDR